MARKQRYHIPGAFYHVMLRGNNGQAIFLHDEERCRMCLLIQEGVERYGHRIHAYCLMGNHVHLLIQVGNIPLSTIFHNLAFRYSQFINRRYQKIGHLFQGRFKAILIQEEVYFLRLLRYIHMNPVRAHLVKNPEDYRWSGHGAYAGNSEVMWLTTHYGLMKFADHLHEARLGYQNYVLKQEPEDSLEELRKGFSDGQVLGNDSFLEDIRNSQNQPYSIKIPLMAIIKAICEVYQVEQTALASPSRSGHLCLARGAATFFARQTGLTFTEMAETFQRDASSISRLMQRFSEEYANSSSVKEQYQLLEETATRFANAIMHA